MARPQAIVMALTSGRYRVKVLGVFKSVEYVVKVDGICGVLKARREELINAEQELAMLEAIRDDQRAEIDNHRRYAE